MEPDNDFRPASLLLRPPQVKTIVRQPTQRYDGIRSSKRFQWTARVTFSQQQQTDTPRDRFALLFVHLQLCDPGIQLLPFKSDSNLNPITTAKNIPYDSGLEDYLQLPKNLNAYAKYIPIYVRFSSLR